MKNTIMEQLGISFTSIAPRQLSASMPVDHRTHQPFGLLHGGASAVLAETLGSFGSHQLIDAKHQAAVGVELNINHLNGIKSGRVIGTASLIKEGRTLHVWQIDISDEQGKAIASSRLTVMIKQLIA